MSETGPDLLYLSRADVESLGIAMADIIDAVEDAFRARGEGRVEMPPKIGIHPGRPDADNFIHAMPARIEREGAVGIKWVSGFPGNTRRGLPYISGLLVLNDGETGLPVCVMDCTWITAQRTAAASAVSARHLARLGSRVIGILGCGVQGRSHVEALAAVLPEATTVLAYDIDAERAASFVRDLDGRERLEVIAVGEPREAVEASDVVVTAGPILRTPHATIQPGWMRPGTFASAVDFDSYFSPGAIAECDRLTTDDRTQLAHFREIGYFAGMREPDSELAELVTGTKPGRERDEQRTMAVNLGLALEDMAVAPLVMRAALARGAGRRLPL